MPYLKEDEMGLSWDLGLTEAGNMGHIVPGHKYILDLVSTSYYWGELSEHHMAVLTKELHLSALVVIITQLCIIIGNC